MSDPGNYAGNTDRSIGQLVAAATAEMSALVHDEIALAKAEVRQDAKRGAIGSIAFVAAGVFALFSIPVLSFAAAYGIHNLGLGLAWSFLIVGGAFIALGLLLAFLGIRKFKKVKPPEKSIASAKQTAAVLQNAKPHPRPSVEAAAIIERSGSSLAKGVEGGTGRDNATAVARSST
ncbi:MULTISPECIES: phage holin family protein [Streptomyces]|uniref:Transporter n=2 Tax=Streptomyces TaxID=1883 RepID=A0A1V0UBJ4_STRVN|nr:MULTISPECIES: phage holin family protein [Streptomyces]MYW80528.1 phage holin family protein [Streptomyces sp. SID8369]NEA10519.1 phage holin family protein [Streptomyces sp. SID10692]ARF62569.1 transporter [Streptomyces violaceoruber]KOG83121.1 transporter [Streptomyces griseus subsp. rhodochrous]KOU09108.1 transporter [Streptomyces sp. NRRL F-2295]